MDIFWITSTSIQIVTVLLGAAFLKGLVPQPKTREFGTCGVKKLDKKRFKGGM